MPDEPVIIKGGSLNITIKAKSGDVKHTHPTSNGKLTSVDIDGKNFPVNADSEIVIHYDVPDSAPKP